MRPRRTLALLLAAALWCGLFAVLESYRTVKLYLNRPWTDETPSAWRPGSPTAERLGELLAAADRELPGGSWLIFDGTAVAEAERPYLAMWAAYLAPRHQLLPPAAELTPLATHRLVYAPGTASAPPPPAAPDALLTTPAGALYRLP